MAGENGIIESTAPDTNEIETPEFEATDTAQPDGAEESGRSEQPQPTGDAAPEYDLDAILKDSDGLYGDQPGQQPAAQPAEPPAAAGGISDADFEALKNDMGEGAAKVFRLLHDQNSSLKSEIKALQSGLGPMAQQNEHQRRQAVRQMAMPVIHELGIPAVFGEPGKQDARQARIAERCIDHADRVALSMRMAGIPIRNPKSILVAAAIEMGIDPFAAAARKAIQQIHKANKPRAAFAGAPATSQPTSQSKQPQSRDELRERAMKAARPMFRK